MKIGIDLDDVVLDFFPSFFDFYNRRYGVNFKISDVTSYNIWEIGIGRTKEEAVSFIDEFYESDDYDGIPFVEGSREGLDELGRDNELLIITSRLTRYKPTKTATIKNIKPTIEKIFFLFTLLTLLTFVLIVCFFVD